MIPQAVIVDYGVGNLFSMECALKRAGFNVKVAKSPDNILEADAVVLPGVGNFKTASKNLKPFKAALSKIIEDGASLLGVCLGMQLLFEGSEESPGEGLCLLEGNVLRLPDRVKTPHMGWNTLKILRWNPLLDGIDENSYLYFVHSYYAKPRSRNLVVAETSYGVDFASVVAKGNVYGTQFHPEKSGKPGAKILLNFAKIVKG